MIHGLAAKNLALMGCGRLLLCPLALCYDVSFAFLPPEAFRPHSTLGGLQDDKQSSKELMCEVDELVQSIQVLNPTVTVQAASATFDVSASLAAAEFTAVAFSNAASNVMLRLTPLARASLTKVVASSLYGVAARIFTDVGPSHHVLDASGEQPATCAVTSATAQGTRVTIQVAPDTPHGLEVGDSFTLRGMGGGLAGLCGPPLVVLEAPSRNSVVASSSTAPFTGTASGQGKTAAMHTSSGYLVAQPRQLTVAGYDWSTADRLSLPAPDAALPDAASDLLTDAMTDFTSCPLALHLALSAAESLSAASTAAGATGASWVAAVTDAAQAALAELLDTPQQLRLTQVPKDIKEQLPRAVAAVCRGAGPEWQLAPLVSVVGGLAAHEVVKLLTAQHTPHRQWWSIDYSSLPSSGVEGGTSAVASLLGQPVHSSLANARVFIVGAGAIGCEWIKLLAAMGACTGASGHLTITDMDNIEMSNLSRQFLFRAEHVRQPKSVVAAQAAQQLNPALAGHVTALTDAVGRRSEHCFDDTFWQQQDIIITALDNVDARLYVDGKCVQFGKPMFDSGTVGAKGSTQVVLPYLTENYGATKDPPQASFPVCTLKNFPYRIEHTLQWAQDWFHGALCSSLQYALAWMQHPEALLHDVPHSARLQAARQAVQVVAGAPATLEDCIRKARTVFQAKFHDDMLQLLHQYPADLVDEDGVKFWSGTKRAPTPATFDIANTQHVQFVTALAAATAQAHGIDHALLCPEKVQAALADVSFAAFQPDASVVIAATEEEAAAQAAQTDAAARLASGSLDEQVMAAFHGVAPALPAGVSLQPLHFDKDDDLMMQVVAAVSNMRASCYGIPTQDLHSSRRIAGNIIPAIATTTAVVAGLAGMEMLRYLAGERGAEKYRCAFLNMALPLFMLSEPVRCSFTETVLAAGVQFVPPGSSGDMLDTTLERTWRWSLWDCVQVQHPTTLGQLLDHVQATFGLEVCMVNFGVASLYSDLMSTPARLEKKRAHTIPELIASVTGEGLPNDTHHVELMTICVDENDNEVEIPTIKYML